MKGFERPPNVKTSKDFLKEKFDLETVSEVESLAKDAEDNVATHLLTLLDKDNHSEEEKNKILNLWGDFYRNVSIRLADARISDPQRVENGLKFMNVLLQIDPMQGDMEKAKPAMQKLIKRLGYKSTDFEFRE
jgi:hypothetical protein